MAAANKIDSRKEMYAAPMVDAENQNSALYVDCFEFRSS